MRNRILVFLTFLMSAHPLYCQVAKGGFSPLTLSNFPAKPGVRWSRGDRSTVTSDEERFFLEAQSQDFDISSIEVEKIVSDSVHIVMTGLSRVPGNQKIPDRPVTVVLPVQFENANEVASEILEMFRSHSRFSILGRKLERGLGAGSQASSQIIKGITIQQSNPAWSLLQESRSPIELPPRRFMITSDQLVFFPYDQALQTNDQTAETLFDVALRRNLERNPDERERLNSKASIGSHACASVTAL